MAITSQNGWSANDRSLIASYALPGGKVALRKGDVSVILLWCAQQWHATVEPLVWPGIWGYAERTVRGSTTTLSNHASGTAIDCNAPQHPLGTAITANFTAREIVAVRAILEFCENVVRWGGDYSGRKDGMHLEINRGAAQVARIADKIREWQTAQLPVIVTVPVVFVPPVAPAPAPARVLRLTDPRQEGEDVRAWQGELWRCGVGVGAHDAFFGPAVDDATRYAQRAAGIDDDGMVGPDARSALAKVREYLKKNNRTFLCEPDGDNDTIRMFQQRFKDRGWKVTVDGFMSPGGETQKAIKAFQKEKQLDVDGIGGAEVWIALWTRGL